MEKTNVYSIDRPHHCVYTTVQDIELRTVRSLAVVEDGAAFVVIDSRITVRGHSCARVCIIRGVRESASWRCVHSHLVWT